MGPSIIALFGEAEKGAYRHPYDCHTVDQLLETVGLAPPNSRGIYFAIQALHYKRDVIYFRVREEGFSVDDYFEGVWLLDSHLFLRRLDAICLPGVGDAELIHRLGERCLARSSFLITTECDLYDYLTQAA